MDGERDARSNLPKLREILRRQREDSESFGGDVLSVPDIDFTYSDTDTYSSEIAELYCYSEEEEFFQNQNHFETFLKKHTPGSWSSLPREKKKLAILNLLESVEVCVYEEREKAVKSLLYLCQGNFADSENEAELRECSRENVFLLFECGAVATVTHTLYMEVDASTSTSSVLRKPAVSLSDSTDLRALLSILYIMVETIRQPLQASPGLQDHTLTHREKLRETFFTEIGQPLILGSGEVDGADMLAVYLFSMVTKFCSGVAPHFPIKKVLLLLWKVLLTSLGGMETLQQLKTKYRQSENLAEWSEDTMSVVRTMRAASPPMSAADLIDQQQQQQSKKLASAINSYENSMEDDSSGKPGMTDGGGEDEGFTDDNNSGQRAGTPRPDSPIPTLSKAVPSVPKVNTIAPPKGLLWKPKVREQDLEQFLDATRTKFVGFQTLKSDCTSLAGLPPSIHEGVGIFRQYLYVSLSEVQIKREEVIVKNPLTCGAQEVLPTNPVEVLYQGILTNLPQYMIALLKILLAAAPTSKCKTDSINIMADVLPENMPMNVIQSMKLGIDVNRHKEIIVKATSAIILLLLKHLKLNHIYQFEYMSQHLVFANCIPLILKFLNQNIMTYITAKNGIPVLDFPACVMTSKPELTAESLEELAESSQNGALYYCWRNLFSCINLLRVLNKLTKWKHSRTMMLVVFKSAPILKRALKVKQPLMQLYVLKLLKMQTKYLGRQWRKSNMKTISAIYHKVRHRLNDDWAYGNDLDARPWDFQAEECALRSHVDRFNARRYSKSGSTMPSGGNAGTSNSGIFYVDQHGRIRNPNQQNTSPDGKSQMFGDAEYLESVDNNVVSVLGEHTELTPEFKANYEQWLNREVFEQKIDWDKLLTNSVCVWPMNTTNVRQNQVTV